jgi:hypothetical protein
MHLIKEGKPINYKTVDGQDIPVIQPEVYQRIYCKNCDNEVNSEDMATGLCTCGKSWADTKTVDITVKVIEMPPIGSKSGE